MSVLSPHKTVIRNISGVDGRFFGYLPPHGATIDDGDDFGYVGDLFSVLAKRPRDLAAFQADLDNDVLAVIRTPTVVDRDSSTGVFRRLVFASGPSGADLASGSYTGAASSQ